MLELLLRALQDAVRGDHVEVTKLLLDHGGKIFEDGKVMSSCRKSCTQTLCLCKAHICK